jgi:predicted dehydrogenase
MISHRFAIEEAERAYQVVGGSEPSLGILLAYPDAADYPDEKIRGRTVKRRAAASVATPGTNRPPLLAVIVSGNYATAVLAPALKAAGAQMGSIASSGGVSGAHAAQKFDFEETTTDLDAIFNDASVDAVVIATRHDSHARLAVRAIETGKHVFVEKPLALTHEEIDAIEAARAAAERGAAPRVMVGFNRRFAPHVVKLRQLLAGCAAPKSMIMTINAGTIPPEHWTQDALAGGGRIIGEGCHFIDLLRHLVGAPIESHSSQFMQTATQDTATISLRFADGSIGAIHYFANGHKLFPKERLEVFAEGRVIRLDNFLRLSGFGYDKFDRMSLWRQDKGQQACAAAFVDSIAKGGPDPIPFDELIEVARATIDIAKSNT